MTFLIHFSHISSGTGSHSDKGDAGKPGSEGPRVPRDLQGHLSRKGPRVKRVHEELKERRTIKEAKALQVPRDLQSRGKYLRQMNGLLVGLIT